MKLAKDYTVDYRYHGTITVPKGTPLTHMTAHGRDENYHFVNSLDWIKPHDNGTPNYMLRRDVEYYGINVPKEYVDFEDFTDCDSGYCGI